MMPEPLNLSVAWLGADDLPAMFANAFLFQVNDEDIFLTAGTVAPPVFPNETSPEERREALAASGHIIARPIVRLALNRVRLQDLKIAVDSALELLEMQDAARSHKS